MNAARAKAGLQQIASFREFCPFAALILLSVGSIVIDFARAGLSQLLLRRLHDSAVQRKR